MTRRRGILLALAVLVLCSLACTGPLGGGGGQDGVDKINAEQATRAIVDGEATKEAYNGQ